MALYTWKNRADIWLPMKHGDHDPVNSCTLNRGRGGAALNAVWPVAPGIPTKLGTRHGYSFDGGDRLGINAATLAAGTYTVCMCGDFAIANGNTLFDCSIGFGGTGLCVVVGTTITPSSGTVYVNGVASAVAYDGTRTIVITGMAIDCNLIEFTIFADTGGGNNPTGNLFEFGLYPGTLTPHQVAQYHREAFAGLHTV